MKLFILTVLVYINVQVFAQNNLNSKIEKILEGQVSNELAPGLTVAVIKNGQTIYHNSRGCMNLSYQLPFNDSTQIGLASVTKQFTVACIGVLEKQGKLTLRDDVRKYIPELAFYGDTIRIKHLLNHTSGIRNHNVLLDLKGFDYKHQGYTNKMIQELMFRQRGINNPAGAKMLYSNTNYVLLALIVERVSGLKIHEFAKKELFDPLKMSNTFYENDLEAVINNRALPYYKKGDQYKQAKSLTLCVGAGGMVSTVKDMAKWSQLFLNTDHEFSYLKEFITQLDTLNNGKLMKHARGMFVSSYKNHTNFNHSGRDRGMRAQFICVPDYHLGVIVYTNSNYINAVDISYEILDLFLASSNSSSQRQTHYKHSITELRSFAGIYQELNSDLRMTVFVEDDTLKALSSFGRQATSLISKNLSSFSRIDNPAIVYSFDRDKDSNTPLQVDFSGAIFYFERITLEANPNQNLKEYIGDYYSEELDVIYEIRLINGQLNLTYPHHNNIILKEGATDVFGANRRTKYSFIRNEHGEITSFVVAAEGTVKDILFKKE